MGAWDCGLNRSKTAGAATFSAAQERNLKLKFIIALPIDS
jgi:hypothetical protein